MEFDNENEFYPKTSMIDRYIFSLTMFNNNKDTDREHY